jgi:hypothetical protein
MGYDIPKPYFFFKTPKMSGIGSKLTLTAAEAHGLPGPRLNTCLNFDQFRHM